MRRVLAVAVMLPLILAATGCGDDGSGVGDASASPSPVASERSPAASPEDTGAEQPAEEPSGTAGDDDMGTDGAAADAVERYCQDVDELIAAYREAVADPGQGTAAELARRARELTEEAADLIDDALRDASIAERVRECSARLENLGNPEVPS